MTTYQDLLAQRAELDAQIQKARKTESSDAIKRVREMVAQFDLTAEDIFGAAKAKAGAKDKAKAKPAKTAAKTAAKAKRPPVPPKYRDPATGKTWAGRGRAPKWIEGQDRSAFLIA